MNIIRLAEFEELDRVSSLMRKIFMQRMQDLYDEEGRTSLLSQLSLSSVQKRFLQNSRFYLCEASDKLLGVLEIERPGHIAFVFVDPPGKGIGRQLCETALSETEEEIATVGASAQAVGFYTKLGFEKISKEELVHGMPFTLMAKKLS